MEDEANLGYVAAPAGSGKGQESIIQVAQKASLKRKLRPHMRPIYGRSNRKEVNHVAQRLNTTKAEELMPETTQVSQAKLW